MSLYLGKDVLNEAMLVISKNYSGENAIRNSLPSISNNFAVDTRRDLLFCDVINIASPTYIRSYSNGGLTYYVYRVQVTNSFLVLNGNKRMSLYFINNFTYRVNFNLMSELDQSVFGANSYYQGKDFVDIHTLYSNLSDIALISLRITDNGVSNPYEVVADRTIKVSNSEFLVNGIDYFSRNFLVTPPVNLVDDTFDFGGKTIQIVNSENTVFDAAVTLSNSRLVVNNGTKTILDSSADYLQLFMQDQAPVVSNFKMPGGFDSSTITITTVPSTYKVLGVTYYPRVSVYPAMKAYGLLVNSGTTALEVIYQDTFPVDRNGEIIDGFMSLGFYIENGVIKAQKIVEYDGDPIGTYPSIQMRLDYIVVSE